MVEAPIGFICRQIHARPFASGAVCFLAGILIADALPIIFWGVLAFAAILFAIFCRRYRRASDLPSVSDTGRRANAGCANGFADGGIAVLCTFFRRNRIRPAL